MVFCLNLRKCLTHFKTEKQRHKFYAILIQRVILNRYFFCFELSSNVTYISDYVRLTEQVHSYKIIVLLHTSLSGSSGIQRKTKQLLLLSVYI